MVRIRIDGQEVSVPEGTRLLDAIRQTGGDVPTVCYHPHLTANALCRLCLVEVEGWSRLAPACVTQAQEGMVVYTASPRVERVRRTLLTMLAEAVDLHEAADLQPWLQRYGITGAAEAHEGTRRFPLIDDNPMYVRDYSKCVLCWKCVQICAADAQYTFAITLAGRGFDTRIATFYEVPLPESPCVFCGQCVSVCPTGALKSRREYLLEQGYMPEDFVHFAAWDAAAVHPTATAFRPHEGEE